MEASWEKVCKFERREGEKERGRGEKRGREREVSRKKQLKTESC